MSVQFVKHCFGQSEVFDQLILDWSDDDDVDASVVGDADGDDDLDEVVDEYSTVDRQGNEDIDER